MQGLDLILDDLVKTAQDLIEVANGLKWFLSPPQPTFEEVREIMVEKASLGYKAEIKEILQKYSVTKLSELKETQYAEVLKDLKAVG